MNRRLESFEPCPKRGQSRRRPVLQSSVQVGSVDGQSRRRAILGEGLTKGRLEVERDAFEGEGRRIWLARAEVSVCRR